MKITASNTQLIQPKVSPVNNNNVAEGILKLDDKNVPSLSERLSSGLDQVANIYEPKDYGIGRTQIIGTLGDINDFDMHIKFNEYNNFTINHNVKNNRYLGFSIFKNNKLI